MSVEIPEELETVWNQEVADAFGSLKSEHQDFLLEYLRNGNNATQAYRKTYSETLSDNVANAASSRLLHSVKVNAVLSAFTKTCVADLFLIVKTYKEATEAFKPVFGKDSDGQPELIQEIPDWANRIKAADSLANLHGFNAAQKREISGAINVVSTPADEAL